MDNKEPSKRDFKKLFNFNNILAQLINFTAYIILTMSVLILLYLSFVEKFDIKIDWLTLGIFAFATVFLSYVNWITYYRKHYEKLMADDIAQHSMGKYSIHARYYFASKDWTDIELQKKIDEFNDEYTAKWLRWVEKTTGFPIETRDEVQLDENGKPMLDENGKPIIVTVKGIKDLPYKGFKHKFLMWRIKTHHYPQSGYKTSMELMSLLSFQDANLNKRNLKAAHNFFMSRSISKLFSSIMTITVGASVIPEMISGNYWSAILKLLIAIISLFMSVLTGATNGIKGARLKLSTVEDACVDLERWGNKKPRLAPYASFEEILRKEVEIEEQAKISPAAVVSIDNEGQQIAITKDIFNLPK